MGPIDVKVSFKINIYGNHIGKHLPMTEQFHSWVFTCVYIHQKICEECFNSPIYNSPKLGVIQMLINKYTMCAHTVELI